MNTGNPVGSGGVQGEPSSAFFLQVDGCGGEDGRHFRLLAE